MNRIGKYDQLQTVAKLLNTQPTVLMDFFVDVGLEVLSRTNLHLLKSLKSSLDNFLESIEPAAAKSIASKNQLPIFTDDELKNFKDELIPVLKNLESKKN